MRVDKILLVCTGNICRSPMAAAVLGKALTAIPGDWRVASAGTHALVDHPAEPLAVALMDERGLDIADHRGRLLTAEVGYAADLLLVMDGAQRGDIARRWPALRGRVHKLGLFGGFEIDDPYRRPRAAFEASLVAIERGVADWLPALQALNGGETK